MLGVWGKNSLPFSSLGVRGLPTGRRREKFSEGMGRAGQSLAFKEGYSPSWSLLSRNRRDTEKALEALKKKHSRGLTRKHDFNHLHLLGINAFREEEQRRTSDKKRGVKPLDWEA